MVSKITKDGISQMIDGNEIVAAGMKIMYDGAGAGATAIFRVVLVDRRGVPLAQICAAELSVGDTATLLNLDQAFNITVIPA